ncbi:MAG: hypothetical protein AVDCRST_MAG95-1648 [uncultured Adhaeribacter sp.]|uniref:Phage protein Gp138 N-terminal domain-containing protein n=1 Tax=uncultured Adhaeribacter sp. TaxID=448109 RepID=A0A6J4IB32_9BACT|nr:MAG: hypothetical protein AVDCRST_MAG95-1648 [uncultured Adhaeribacter sp.]
MSESSEIIRALQLASETALSEVNTTQPGKIISYNAKSNRAVVQPVLPKRLASGDPLDAPNIVEVPIVWPLTMGGTCGFTLPIRAGDALKLDFAQRSLEGFLSGKNDAPDDPRRHDLSDAIATPGLQPNGVEVNPNDAVFFFGPVKLSLKPDGSGKMETAGGSWTIGADGNVTYTGTVFVDGDAIVKGDVKAGTISLRNHRHLASGGTGTGGTPAP